MRYVVEMMRLPTLFPAEGSPPSFPVVGHALAMRRDPLRLLTSLARAHGGMAPIRIGPLAGYLLSEPELVSEVFVSKKRHYTRKTRVYRALSEFLGQSILTSEGQDWRIHRRVVQPAFAKRRLTSFADDIARICANAMATWHGEIDASDAMMRLTLQIVSEVLLGTKTDRDAADIGRAVAAAQRHTEAVMAEVVPLPTYLPTARNRAFHEAVRTLDRVAYGIIDERRRSGEVGNDAVSMLLEARYEDGSPLSRERIRNELITLLAAGHETTANALSWTLMRLSLHPDIARRVVEEVDSVIGSRLPTFEDLPRLTFIRRVFDEALRLHPPAWVTGRMVMEPHELGGRPMTPGTMVIISPYVTHRRPDIWDNPEGFDPDRWEKLGERGALHPFAFYPFGGGTRKCVGEGFAYLEAVLVLAMIAQQMRLELVPGQRIRPEPQITLGLASGLKMRVVRRR